VELPPLAPRRKADVRSDGRNVETFDRLRMRTTTRPSIRRKAWPAGCGPATTAGTSRGFAPMRPYAARTTGKAPSRSAERAGRFPVRFGSTRFSSVV
jgi:hypothetical protein